MSSAYRRIDVARMAGALGAEIGGITLSEIDDETFAEVRRALNEHQVVVFRDQALSLEAQVAFARRFGPIQVHPNLTPHPDHPEAVAILKEPWDKANVGAEWHADTTMLAEPPLGQVLHAVELPRFGGDTIFANQAAAYEALSEGMQRMLDRMRAVHGDGKVAGPKAGLNAQRSTKVREDVDWRETLSEHPVVRTHPETGRRGLFVNMSYTKRFVGWTEAESASLLDFLIRHATRPEFTCRVRWAPGTTVIWDNRAVLHIAVNDYHGHRRLMHRVTIRGDAPY